MVNLKGKPVELRVPSRMGYEKVAMGTAASVAKLMGFPDDRIEDLKTAIAEACINAIEHGNQLNENLSVGVTLSAHDDSSRSQSSRRRQRHLEAAIQAGHRPQGAWRGRSPGMGMFLIQALVDEAEWVKDSKGTGSYVRLVIRLDKESD